MPKLTINGQREASPQDRLYRLRPTRGVMEALSPAQKLRLGMFNVAVAIAARVPLSQLPVMPVRDMRRRHLGPMNVGFRFGLPAANRGFTMATNDFDVLMNGVIRETAGSRPCLN